ncbi:MAG: terminase, partial [Polyangiaceae bacterium]
GGTVLFRPDFPRDIIADALADDPQSALSEYGDLDGNIQFRDDLSSFIDRAMVDAAIDRGVYVRQPNPNIQHVGFVDSSSGRGDSFTLAIAHAEGHLLIVDCVR